MQIGELGRVPLGTFPTPIRELKNLAERLGGPRLFVKRDDMTGLGLGGNKLRKLEYAFAEAQSLGATVVITIGGPQSNHVRLTTAAANRLGLRTILVLRGDEPAFTTGNLLVDGILGPAEIHFVGAEGFPSKGDMDRIADEKASQIAARLEAEGEIPYVIPNGCKAFHGAIGYAGCVLETVDQLQTAHLAADAIVSAVGTSSTLTGLILGSHLYAQGEIDVIGISVASPADAIASRIARQLDEAVERLEINMTIPESSIEILDRYVGPGYGIPTDEMREAVLLTARSEGVVLDPVYTGKAMAGLIDLIRNGRFERDEVVVFLHTGGTPGLFADTQVETFQNV
jgi:D-cysteine desulfhydrase family pyridoxal phosphate-dependent enzyme